MNTIKIVTIGAYGFNETGFFRALQKAQVDTFCDIRLRRGVRGRQYAFANSQRLQNRLAELGICYLYRQDLAPTRAVRAVQDNADKASKTAKRQRTQLGAAFTAAYEAECLAHFDPLTLVAELPPDAKVVALFCVERTPDACHRSLVAAKLAHELELDVEHLLPYEQGSLVD
ncbi:MAG: DUF488 domain-containing protein [Caldilineaceae bacterium]